MLETETTQVTTKVCSKDTVSEAGLNVWVTGELNGNAPSVDIIAVQGLGAHPYYTWVYRKSPAKKVKPFSRFQSCCVPFRRKNSQAASTASNITEAMWLRDFLPDLIPNARIATYSYESDWRKADIKTDLRKCGEQLLNVLQQNRPTGRRPLILIGHSLGGLVIKQALILADHGNAFKDIRLSTAGIIFLGTPHQGSDAAAFGTWLAQVAGHDTTLLESLKRNTSCLHAIARDFEASYSDADVVCFYENQDALYGPWRTQFVDYQSASLLGKRAMYLTTDHSGLNKFRDPDDGNFVLVWPEIFRMAKEAPQKINERYISHAVASEKALRYQDARDDLEARILETLASDYRSDKDLVSTKVSGTCQWFLEDERFLRWRKYNSSGLLWVSAGPGCGKSVLARALVDEGKVCENSSASQVCFFFFKDGQEQRTRGTDALSALLHQLFESTDLITHATASYRSHGKELRNRFSELWRILLKSAEDSKAGEIVCVLDALDECEEKARAQFIDTLIQFFSHQESCQDTPLKLKFLITSRPYDALEQKFQQLAGVSTYIHLDGDEKSQMISREINLVIDAKIPHITGIFSSDDRARISNRLKQMNNRTYLWLFLTIDIIEKSPSKYRRPADLDALLSGLPSEINEAYEQILRRSEDRHKAQVLLEIVLAATRPLSLEEVNMAMAMATREQSCRSQRDLALWPIESFKATVKNWCGLFVSVYDGKLFLIHQTAREFLIRTSNLPTTGSRRWEGRLDMAAAHGTMSQICLDYLQFPDIPSTHLSQLHPNTQTHLLDYAAKNWVTHYASQNAELAVVSQKAAMSLCDTSLPQGSWFSIYSASEQIESAGWTELGIASYLGLASIAKRFIEEGADINSQSGPWGNALQTASSVGHDQVVAILLEMGADIDARCGTHAKALYTASQRGHDSIVRILLDRNADVNAQSEDGDHALQAASRGGYESIVRMLLDKGANINARGGVYGGNALNGASLGGHEGIVQVLLDEGASLFGGELSGALLAGHDQIVPMLLRQRSEIYMRCKRFGKDVEDALAVAEFQGNGQVVGILKEFGREMK